MKTSRFQFAALVALSLLVATSAYGQVTPPAPAFTLCVDNDHDGYPAAVPCTKADGNKIGTHIAADCDDNSRGINPGAVEVPGNGFDDDCKGGDAALVPAKYRPFGCGQADLKCQTRVDALEANCKAAGAANCTMGWATGQVLVFNGYKKCDSDCDGILNVLSPAQYETYLAELRQGKKCVKNPRPQCDPATGKGCKRSSSGTGKRGTGTGTTVVRIDPTTGKRIDALEAADKKFKTDLDEVVGTVDELDQALADETAQRKAEDAKEREERIAADKKLADGLKKTAKVALKAHTTANEALDAAEDAKSDAKDAKSSGVHFSANVSLGGKLSQVDVPVAMPNGTTQMARGKHAPMVLFTADLGYETPSAIYAVTGGGGIPFDDGPDGEREDGAMWMVGLEACAKLGGPHCLGGVVTFLAHNAGGSINGSNVSSKGVNGGLLYKADVQTSKDSAWRWDFRLMAGVGNESVGTQGEGFEPTTKEGLYGFLTAGIGFGAGPTKQ